MSHDPSLRIFDANANRAREALRVMEDYARFALNDDELSAQLKAIRHDLAAAVGSLLGDAILHRDTVNDVGTDNKTASEGRRTDLGHVVTAAGKRLGEALRVMEEVLKTLSPPAAASLEALRYRHYILEQSIARTLRPGNRFDSVRLYALISEAQCKLPWLDAAEQAILGGADCLQLREKDLESGELLKRARQLVDLCRSLNVLCIINDRPDIALLAKADGVHVGQGDLPATEVRRLIGHKMILGVSTHTLDQARKAQRDGADYIGVGPIFRSPIKPRDFLPGLDFARQVAANIPLPTVAIAGITLENVQDVLATGVPRIAVTSAILTAENPREAAAGFKRALVGQTFLSVSPVSQAIPASPMAVGQTFLSAASGHSCPDVSVPQPPELHKSRRRLPHWTLEGSTYFITFRLAHGELSRDERSIILDHVRSGHGLHYTLLAATIMPDHVHLLLRPKPGVELPCIMKGIKGVTARLINASRHTTGSIWQAESFDRIVRNQAELDEKLQYMLNNPAKRNLVSDPWDYPWWFLWRGVE